MPAIGSYSTQETLQSSVVGILERLQYAKFEPPVVPRGFESMAMYARHAVQEVRNPATPDQLYQASAPMMTLTTALRRSNGNWARILTNAFNAFVTKARSNMSAHATVARMRSTPLRGFGNYV